MKFKHYHFCHLWDDARKQSTTVQTLSLWTPGAHLSMRNTGMIGLSMCGMWRNPVTGKFHAIQDAQVEQMAATSAELVHLLDLDPIKQVNDHVHFARIDGYGPGSGHPQTKVDIGAYEPIVRNKMMVYLNRIGRGTYRDDGSPWLTAKLF